MFTTGSKLFVGATAVAVVAAVLYGVTQDGTLGVMGLVSAAIALGLVAIVVVATRDANVSAMDDAAASTAPATTPPPAGNVWPLVTAGGAALVVLGLVTQPAFVILGVALAVVAGFQWAVDAWTQGASSEATFNREARLRFAGPLELPLLATVVAAVVVFSFSRIMLFLSKTAGPAAFGVIALLVLVGGFVFASMRSLRSGAIAGVTALAAIGLIAGGIATGLDGEREIEAHETTGQLGEEGLCESVEETHADENASQTVGNKASVMAYVTLHGDGTLTARVPGGEPTDHLYFARGNSSNVIFRNDSDTPRRLTLTTGTRAVVDEEGEEIEGEREPDQQCTALTEEGALQLLTFRVDKGSAASEDPFEMTVPGVDTAVIEVVVS